MAGTAWYSFPHIASSDTCSLPSGCSSLRWAVHSQTSWVSPKMEGSHWEGTSCRIDEMRRVNPCIFLGSKMECQSVSPPKPIENAFDVTCFNEKLVPRIYSSPLNGSKMLSPKHNSRASFTTSFCWTTSHNQHMALKTATDPNRRLWLVSHLCARILAYCWHNQGLSGKLTSHC